MTALEKKIRSTIESTVSTLDLKALNSLQQTTKSLIHSFFSLTYKYRRKTPLFMNIITIQIMSAPFFSIEMTDSAGNSA